MYMYMYIRTQYMYTYFTEGTEGVGNRSLEGLVSLSSHIQNGERTAISAGLPHRVIARVCARELPERKKRLFLLKMRSHGKALSSVLEAWATI